MKPDTWKEKKKDYWTNGMDEVVICKYDVV